MIERKIHVGEFISFGDIGDAGSADPGQVTRGVEERKINYSHGFKQTKREVEQGQFEADNKQHRNFIWLPWVKNSINYTESNGKDVLSGAFTGCIMVLYKYAGVRRVGHISLPDAKDAWNALMADPQMEVLAGFKPHENNADGALDVVGDDSVLKIYGLITNDGRLYSITTFIQKIDKAYSRIASVALMQSMDLNVLRNLP